jgi:flavin reductase (DIM6/NTAB) family NADH-FMN oxidoreductase RutF
MALFASGVTVVTARHAGEDSGMTVSAFFSVTLEPPRVLVSLSEDADTTPLVEASGRFAVNLLAADQEPLSVRFAERLPPREKMQGVAFHRGTDGVVLLDGTLGALECRVENRFPVGDHVLLVGTVEQLHEGRRELPLLYWNRGYGTLERRSAGGSP